MTAPCFAVPDVGEPPDYETPYGDYPLVVTKPSGDRALVVQDYAFGKYLGYLKVSYLSITMSHCKRLYKEPVN